MSFNDVFSEQEYKQSTKTDDELRRLTLEEDLSETKRSFNILTKGQHLQKSAEDIQNQEEEQQIQAAESLVKAVEAKFLNKDQVKQIFGLTMIMLKIWSQPVLDAWVLVFREILLTLPYPMVEEETNRNILQLSDSSQPAVSRYIAGRMIGFVAEVRKDRIKGSLIERSRVLCSDHDTLVRKVLASEVMIKLTKGMGSSEQIEMHLLDKVLQLMYDSEINVKCLGIELIFTTAPLLSMEQQKNNISKIFFEMLSNPKEEIQVKMSGLIGPILQLLQPFLAKNQLSIQTILTAFKDYGTHKNIKIRENFAYNIPAIMSLIDTRISFEKLRILYLNMLMKDPSKDARYKLVASFHEITGILASEELLKHLLTPFKELLKETTDNAIVSRIVANFHAIIRNFIKAAGAVRATQATNDETKDKTCTIDDNFEESLINGLAWFAKDLGEKQHNWRLKVEFFDNLSKCLDVINMATFGKLFIPVILSSLRNESEQVRYSAAGILAKFIASNEHSQKTKEILCELLGKEFLKANAYQLRISFIFFVEHATQLYSRRFFKRHSLFNVLHLAIDPVKSVRVRLARTLPKIRYMLDFDDSDDEDSDNKYGDYDTQDENSDATMTTTTSMSSTKPMHKNPKLLPPASAATAASHQTLKQLSSNNKITTPAVKTIQRIQYDNEIDLFDKAFTKLSNKKDSLVSQEAERAKNEIEMINFDSNEVTQKIKSMDAERRRNEDRLLEMENKLREDQSKPTEKDEFDYLFRNNINSNNNYDSSSTGNNSSNSTATTVFHSQYKKRYSARITMSPNIISSQQSPLQPQPQQISSVKSRQLTHANTASLKTLAKYQYHLPSPLIHPSTSSLSTSSNNSNSNTPLLPSIYNSPQLKSASAATNILTAPLSSVKKVVSRTGFEKPSSAINYSTSSLSSSYPSPPNPLTHPSQPHHLQLANRAGSSIGSAKINVLSSVSTSNTAKFGVISATSTKGFTSSTLPLKKKF